MLKKTFCFLILLVGFSLILVCLPQVAIDNNNYRQIIHRGLRQDNDL